VTGAAGTPRLFNRHRKCCNRGNAVKVAFRAEVKSLSLHMRSVRDNEQLDFYLFFLKWQFYSQQVHARRIKTRGKRK
jgi:hypothetical protein